MAAEETDQNIDQIFIDENSEYRILSATETYKRIIKLNIETKIKINAIHELNLIQNNVKSRMFKKSKQDEVIFVALFKAFINCNIPVEPPYIFELIETKIPSVDKVLSKYQVQEIKQDNLIIYYIDRYLELDNSAEKLRNNLIQSSFMLINSILTDENDPLYVWACSKSDKNVIIAFLTSYLEEQIKSFNIRLWCQACKITLSTCLKYKKSFEDELTEFNHP